MRTGRFFAAVVIGWAMLSSISFGYSGGDGSAENPYQIADANDLNSIGLHSEDWGKCFILTDDIDMGDITGTQYNIIGNSTTKFTGVFDGNGYIVFNLSYVTTSYINYVGLFGNISGAVITDLRLEDIYFSVNSCYTGGLAGYSYNSTIDNCYSTGTVSCFSSAQQFLYVGGLAAVQSGGTVINCRSTAMVECISFYSCPYVGGLVGYQEHGTIVSSYSTGSVTSSTSYVSSYAGGLVGYQYSSNLKNCYSTGVIDSSASMYPFTGGLVGIQYEGSRITLCFNTGSVISTCSQGYSYAGGLAGAQIDSFISNCYNTGAVTSSSTYSSSYAGGLVGTQGSNPATGITARMEKCYSTGQVTATGGGGVYRGGVAGSDKKDSTTLRGVIDVCFWDIQTSATSDGVGNVNPDPVGAMGKITEEMQTLSTFTAYGLDFTNETVNGTNDYWRMCVDGVVYPQLNWESIDGDFACPDGVSTEDLDYFVGRWLMDNCTADNNYCGGGDVDGSGTVDLGDFAILAGHWLEGT